MCVFFDCQEDQEKWTFKSHLERIAKIKTRYVSLRQLLMGFAVC